MNFVKIVLSSIFTLLFTGLAATDQNIQLKLDFDFATVANNYDAEPPIWAAGL